MNNYKKFVKSGKIVDVINRKIYSGTIIVENGIISDIVEDNNDNNEYILPGFIDSHIHIESSMLIPSEFARLAVMHGTVATISDPHEIANVLGIEGIDYMINNGNKVPFKFYFGAPSCVPATLFETSGAEIGIDETEELLKRDSIKYLAEMMNFPGVIFENHDVIKKIEIAKKYNKPIDGHAPGLISEDLKKYANAGITTDHECMNISEAEEKIKNGMKILIREGSAAKNFDELIPLIEKYSNSIMLCSDDKHPDELLIGHINLLVKRAIEKGYDKFDILRSVSYNPIKHYNLDVGLLRKGDSADFIIVNNLLDFKILQTFIKGISVSKNGETQIESVPETIPNIFKPKILKKEDIEINDNGKNIKVIKVFDNQLYTQQLIVKPKVENSKIIQDIDNDILKVIVLNRYKKDNPQVCFANNFGLKRGAFASSVAHDSHNIIAVGTTDEEILNAIYAVMKHKGGIAVIDGEYEYTLYLPVAGLMSNENGFDVAEKYKKINEQAKLLGTNLNSPFMTLSFIALLVIPELKISDKGLFDVKKFDITSIYV